MTTVERGRELLQAHGLRVTAPRLAVLAVLEELPHATVEEIEAAARERLGSLSTQAIYDILHTFHGVGIVRRIEPAGSAARFETRVGDNHHHLVCRDCGLAVDVDCVTGEAPCLAPDDAAGFEVGEAEVIFWGRCPDCRMTKETPAWTASSRPSAAATRASKPHQPLIRREDSHDE